MYYYKLGYWTYEGSDYIVLTHDTLFNKKEFHDMIHKCIYEVLKEVPEEFREYHNQFADFLYDVEDKMIELFGFSRLLFSQEWDIFGWGDMMDKSDWQTERTKEFDDLTKYLNERGLKTKDSKSEKKKKGD